MVPIRVPLALLLVLAPAGMAAQPPMDRLIRAAIADFRGEVCLYARNLDTGASYGIRENQRVRTASTIKLPVMVAAFAAVERGSARWDELLEFKTAQKISGSGVLGEFSDGVRLPLRDLVHLMIVVSDNTATNLVLDRITANAVNAEMDRLELTQTRSLRKVMGGDGQPAGISQAGRIPENQRFGLGVSTPREMVLLLEKLERGEVVSAAASREMIEILKRQQYKDGIGRKLGETPVASKSGALDHLRSDVGIVYSPGGRIAIAVTVDGMAAVDYSADNAGNLLISRLTGFLLDGLRNPRKQAAPSRP